MTAALPCRVALLGLPGHNRLVVCALPGGVLPRTPPLGQATLTHPLVAPLGIPLKTWCAWIAIAGEEASPSPFTELPRLIGHAQNDECTQPDKGCQILFFGYPRDMSLTLHDIKIELKGMGLEHLDAQVIYD